MAVDGTINIDMQLANGNQFISDIKHITQLLSGVGDGAGDKMDASFADNAKKVTDQAAQVHNKVETELSRDVQQDVKIKANTTDFDSKSERVEQKKAKNKKSTITKTKGDTKDFDEKANRTEREKTKLKKPISVRIIADLQKFSGNMRSAKEQLSNLRDQGNRVKGVFSGSFLGSFLGNTVSSGLSLLANGIKTAGAAAIDYDKQLQTLQATWSTLTGSASEGKKMVDMTLQMASAANNSVDMVEDLNTKMYAVTNSAGKTKELTNAMLTLQDAFGQSDDAVKGFATQFSQMQGNGKVSAQDMMSFINVFAPMRQELLKTMQVQTGNHDLTMQQMNDMMSDGKISSDVMDKVLLKMQKEYANASTTFAQTLDGLGRTVKSSAPRLLGEMTAPFLDQTVNPIMKGLAGWFSSTETDALFKNESGKVSKSLNNMFDDIKDSLNVHGSLNDILDAGVEKFSDRLVKVFDWVGDHAGEIKSSADSVISIGKSFGTGVWEGGASAIKIIAGAFNVLTGNKSSGDTMHSVADALKSIASHKDAIETIGKMWGTYWVASKFFGIASGIGAIALGIDRVYKASKNLIGKGNGKDTTGVMQDIVNKIRLKIKAVDVPIKPDTDPLTNTGSRSKFAIAGKVIGTTLVGGMAVAFLGFDIYQAVTAKSDKQRWQAIGGGIGTALGGGIGFFFGGPAGAAIGMSIGQFLGQKAGPAIKKSLESFWDPQPTAKKGSKDYYEQLAKKYRDTASRLQQNTPGFGPGSKKIQDEIDHYNKLAATAEKTAKRINKASDSTKKKSSKKTTTKEAIEDVAVVHVTKGDIKNVKAMIPAMKDYEDALKSLKSFLKDNDPSKKIKSINSNLSKNTKGWDKLAKPIRTIGSAFKTLTSFSKSMGKNDAFAELNADLPKLDATLKNQKIGGNLKAIGTSIKDSKIQSRLHSLTNSVKSDTSKWTKFAKPIKTVGTAFGTLTKFLNTYSKKDPFQQLTKSVGGLATEMDYDKLGNKFKSLTTTLKNNNPGGQLKKMNTEVKTATKTWSALAKPLNTLNKAFTTLNSVAGKIGGKNDPFAKLNTDFNNLKQTLNKTNIGKLLQNQMDTANDALGKKNTGFVGTFSQMVKTIKSDLKSFKSAFNKDWKALWDDAYNNLDRANSRIDKASKTHNSTMRSIQDSFHAAYLKSEKGWLDNVVSSFRDAFNKLPKLAYDPLKKVVGYLNTGISGVDYVIGKFGGSKSLISPIKFATGTGLLSQGRLTRPTLATLNDGNDSPATGNIERVIHADGSSYEPSGRFATQMLMPGDGVLNASENRVLKEMHYFAEGTGALDPKWFKGIDGSGQTLIDLAERLSKNINKSFSSLFGKKPKIKGDVQNAFKGVFDRETKNQGNQWWSTVWSLINETIGSGGDASGLLAAVEKYGNGKPYVWGATGPDSFDCSGLVMYSLKKAFGILYPRVSGDQINHAKRISSSDAKPGDLVGNEEHIGVYAGNGKYYSAMSPSSNPNIGMSSVSSFPGTPRWGRVTGIKSESDDKKKTKEDGSLRTFVKNELGANMFNWIKKNLAPLEETAGTASGGTVSGDLIRRAAEIAGISVSASDMAKIQNVIQHESGGSATISGIDDHDGTGAAKGLLQYKQSTFNHYAMSGHKNILSALDQLVALFNDTTWRSDLTLGGWGPSGSVRHADGGWGTPGALNVFNEPGETEVAINPARPSADRLIKETIQKRIEHNPNGYFAKAAQVVATARQHAQTFHSGAAWAQPVQSAKVAANSNATAVSGSTTINFVADGQTLASVVYPKTKLMQQKDITIAAKKGALH